MYYLVQSSAKETVMSRIGGRNFKVGQRVEMLQCDNVIDRGVIRQIGTGGAADQLEIVYESQEFNPGTRAEFAFFPSHKGWRMLFTDPMTGGRCISQNAPLYVFKPI